MRRLLRGRLHGVTLALAALMTVAMMPSSGCTTETVPGECRGGIEIDGRCVEACHPDKCLEGNTCVDNACRLFCRDHYDCLDEQQECTPVVDDFDRELTVCMDSGRARLNHFLGLGTPCPIGFECGLWGCDGNEICDPVHDPACVPPRCRPVQYCPNGLQCDFFSCGGNPEDCQKNCEGEDCNIGRCRESGERCVLNTCSVAECKPMRCIRPDGSTVVPGVPGEGDADAYCTYPDCVDDDACGAGFYCRPISEAQEVCGASQGSITQAHCGGPSEEPCLDPGAFGNDGASYFHGPSCLMRDVCRFRGECAPCESDLDCSRGLGDVCVPLGADKVCARHCFIDADCSSDQECIETLEQGSVCLPRTGSCRATPPDSFCDYCNDDSDCSDEPGSGWACYRVRGEQRACLNLQHSCDSNAQCPTSPSGRQGVCVTNPQHPLFGICFFPIVNDQPTCW